MVSPAAPNRFRPGSYSIGYKWETKNGKGGFGRLPEGSGPVEQWLCEPNGIPIRVIATREQQNCHWQPVEGLSEAELEAINYS